MRFPNNDEANILYVVDTTNSAFPKKPFHYIHINSTVYHKTRDSMKCVHHYPTKKTWSLNGSIHAKLCFGVCLVSESEPVLSAIFDNNIFVVQVFILFALWSLACLLNKSDWGFPFNCNTSTDFKSMLLQSRPSSNDI